MTAHSRASEIIGERLEIARRARGLSIDQLGEQSGVSVFEIERLEVGVDDPDLEPLVVLSGLFGVDPSFFITGLTRDDLPSQRSPHTSN